MLLDLVAEDGVPIVAGADDAEFLGGKEEVEGCVD